MTTTATPHAGLDEIDARRLLALALADFLQQLDALADDASADTWSIESALDDAGAILAEHADDMPETAATSLAEALERSTEALEWGLEITIPGTNHAFADGLKAADKILDRLAGHGYRIVKADRP
jgi:hypothetical protein